MKGRMMEHARRGFWATSLMMVTGTFCLVLIAGSSPQPPFTVRPAPSCQACATLATRH